MININNGKKNWCEYLVYCLRTNILHGSSFLEKLKYMILLNHFYLFHNGLSELLTSKSSNFFIKKHAVLHRRLNSEFQKLLPNYQKLHFFTFSLHLIICLSWYLHFKHVSLFYVLAFYPLTFGDKSARVFKTYRSSHLKPLTRKSKSPIIFPNI